MKHTQKMLCCLSFTLLPFCANALSQNPLKGLFVGAELGGGLIATQDKQTLNSLFDIGGNPNHFQQNAINTDFGGTTVYGISIGYSFPLGSISALEPSITYNKLTGSTTATWAPNRDVTGTSGGNTGVQMSISPNTSIKQQINYVLTFKRLITTKTSLNIGIGASQLEMNTRVDYATIIASNTASIGQGVFNKDLTMWGAAAELSVQWLLNRHNSLLFTLSDDFYPNRELPITYNVFSSNNWTSNIERYLRVNLTTLTIQYRFYI